MEKNHLTADSAEMVRLLGFENVNVCMFDRQRGFRGSSRLCFKFEVYNRKFHSQNQFISNWTELLQS